MKYILPLLFFLCSCSSPKQRTFSGVWTDAYDKTKWTFLDSSFIVQLGDTTVIFEYVATEWTPNSDIWLVKSWNNEDTVWSTFYEQGDVFHSVLTIRWRGEYRQSFIANSFHGSQKTQILIRKGFSKLML